MDKQRVTLFLDPNLLRRAKAQALKDTISLSQLVEKALNKIVPEVVEIKEIK